MFARNIRRISRAIKRCKYTLTNNLALNKFNKSNIIQYNIPLSTFAPCSTLSTVAPCSTLSTVAPCSTLSTFAPCSTLSTFMPCSTCEYFNLFRFKCNKFNTNPIFALDDESKCGKTYQEYKPKIINK